MAAERRARSTTAYERAVTATTRKQTSRTETMAKFFILEDSVKSFQALEGFGRFSELIFRSQSQTISKFGMVLSLQFLVSFIPEIFTGMKSHSKALQSGIATVRIE